MMSEVCLPRARAIQNSTLDGYLGRIKGIVRGGGSVCHEEGWLEWMVIVEGDDG